MYKRQSRKRPLCPMQSAFRPDTFYILYLSSTPRIWREVIKRQTAYLLHGSLTLAPSLWTDRELRKYHCPLRMSLPTPIAIRLLPYRFNRSFPQNGDPEKSNDFLGRGEAAKLSSFRVYTEAITAKLASTKLWRTYGRGYLRK